MGTRPESESTRPPSGVSGVDAIGRGLIIAACGALIVVLILMFVSPNASYNEYQLGAGGTGVTQQTGTTTCISAWSEMTGNFPVHQTPLPGYQQTNLANAGAACFNVIHGRQAISLLLLIAAVILGVAGGVRYYVRRRT